MDGFLDYGAISILLFLFLFYELFKLLKIKNSLESLLIVCDNILKINGAKDENPLLALSIYDLWHKVSKTKMAGFISKDYFLALHSQGNNFQKIFINDLCQFHRLLKSILTDIQFVIHGLQSFFLIYFALLILSVAFFDYSFDFSGVIYANIGLVVLFSVIFRYFMLKNYVIESQNSLDQFNNKTVKSESLAMTDIKVIINPIKNSKIKKYIKIIFFEKNAVTLVLKNYWFIKQKLIPARLYQNMQAEDNAEFYNLISQRFIKEKTLSNVYSLFHVLIAVSIILMFLLDNIQSFS